MKKWIVIFVSLIVLVLALAGISMVTFNEKEAAPQPKYTYVDVSSPEDGIIVDASQTKDNETSAVVNDWKGRQSVLKWAEEASAEWVVDIPDAGQYELSLGYYPLDGNSQDIEFSLWLDGASLSEGAPFTLNRVWRDEGTIIQTGGNQLRPKQVEKKLWLDKKLTMPEKSGGGTLQLTLSAGKHTLKLENLRESAMLDYLKFNKLEKLPSYEEYRSALGTSVTDDVAAGTFEQIQAEYPYLKSSSGLFPTVDRSSPLTEPYNPVKIRMNTIGGRNWDVSGQWISWKLEAPESGWYKIGLRAHQNKVKGSFVSRKIYLDGNVPFSELEQVRFNYDTSWQIKELGDEQADPYLFYLTKGEHEIKMEVVLGDLTESVQKVQEIVFELNQLYRKIVMITGVMPDTYRDYDLEKSIPELMGEFTKQSEALKSEAARLDQLSEQSSTGSSTLRMLALQLDSFVERPDSIPKRLDSYKSNVTALADWLLTLKSQPLEIDYLYAAAPDVKHPKAEANLAERALHELRTFTGSFMQNYDSLSSDSSAETGERLDVWIGLGRDQAYVLNRMIEDSFTPDTGIHVDLNLVKDALVKAVMAGVGPDVNLFTNRGDTMNLAIRGALEPLDQHEGFSELPSQYMPSAFIPYEYEGHTYAIPDEQQFLMMFTRNDVLQELGLKVPETWEDLMKIAPVLQNNNLQIGLPYESLDAYGLLNQGMGLLNLLPSLLMQNGSGIYNEAHTATRFNETAAFKAFKQWTDFYNLYDYPLYKNDFNRFWTGEMPIVITSYKMYNQLVSVAPEIDGTWSMQHIPGTRQADGTLNYASAANGTAGIILKSAKNKETAWKFMKWWNTPEVQNRFVSELENELGLLGRRTPANVEAFTATNWTRAEQKVLMDQWEQVQEVPELPGGYYTSRNIDNAFRSVVFQWENPREALYYWNKQINEEIVRKRYEFGVKE